MRALAIALAVGLLGGCSQPLAKAVALHNSGQVDAAVADLESPSGRQAVRDTGRDQLLTLMEAGKIFQDGGAGPQSIEMLYQASQLGDRYATLDNRPGAAELVGSAIVNPTVRTYRSTYSERIRVCAYQTLNQLLSGNLREAAVYARRTGERQTDATVMQAKELQAAQKDISEWRGGAASGQVRSILESKQLKELDASAAYAAYLDPFASWIAGIAWCSTGDAQEFRQGASNLQEALQMMPDNATLKSQVEGNPFDAARAGQAQVLVVFETGTAPFYKQVTIPLFTPWTGVSTIPIQVPEYSHPQVRELEVRAGDAAVVTSLLADYNQIFGAQYKRMEADIIFSTLVMIAVKEGATLGGYFATQGNDAAQAGVLIAASLYKAITNQADLRTWRTPGALIGIAQVPRPTDGRLLISPAGGGAPPAEVALPEGLVTLVYVRSVVPGQVRWFVAPLWGTSPPRSAS
jgi:hypothetical protein